MSLCISEQVAAAIKAALDRVVESGDAREARRPVRAGLPTSPAAHEIPDCVNGLSGSFGDGFGDGFSGTPASCRENRSCREKSCREICKNRSGGV